MGCCGSLLEIKKGICCPEAVTAYISYPVHKERNGCFSIGIKGYFPDGAIFHTQHSPTRYVVCRTINQGSCCGTWLYQIRTRDNKPFTNEDMVNLVTNRKVYRAGLADGKPCVAPDDSYNQLDIFTVCPCVLVYLANAKTEGEVHHFKVYGNETHFWYIIKA